MNGDNGSWMMDGRITTPETKPFFFKLRNTFSFKKTGNSYHFFSKKVSISSSDKTSEDSLSEFLADILIKEGENSFFYIYPANDNYVIFSGNMPIMYCMRAK